MWQGTKWNSIPFLAISIKRDSVSFKTSIYRKPTFTGLQSKFHDFAPKQYKENLICTLISRAFQISSDYFDLDSEIERLKTVFQQNGYPLKFIEKNTQKMLNKLYKPIGHETSVKYDVPKPIVYFTTFYLGDISKSLTEERKNIISKFYPQIHLGILFKNCSIFLNKG